MPGLFAGSVFTFITSLEEFNLTFVIGTPTFQTIPTVLFDYLGYHFIRTNAAVVSIILLVPSIAASLHHRALPEDAITCHRRSASSDDRQPSQTKEA